MVSSFNLFNYSQNHKQFLFFKEDSTLSPNKIYVPMDINQNILLSGEGSFVLVPFNPNTANSNQQTSNIYPNLANRNSKI